MRVHKVQLLDARAITKGNTRHAHQKQIGVELEYPFVPGYWPDTLVAGMNEHHHSWLRPREMSMLGSSGCGRGVALATTIRDWGLTGGFPPPVQKGPYCVIKYYQFLK